MPFNVSRIRRMEDHFGMPSDGEGECGPIPIFAPNSWSDEDRDLWERASILHDQELHDDLIERNTGIRPSRCPGRITGLIVPAPVQVEQADEATRAEWRAGRWAFEQGITPAPDEDWPGQEGA